MVVRIRLRHGQAAFHSRNRDAVLAASSLMTPIALMAWALAGWSVAADLKLTGAFAISSGLFSHWQVWVAAGIAVQFAAYLLHRAARGNNYDGELP